MPTHKILQSGRNVLAVAGISLCALTTLIASFNNAHAQQGKREILREQVNPKTETEDPWLGGNWQVGAYGMVESNPYRGADSVDLSGFPIIAYDAERMHIGIDGIDIKAWKNDLASVSLIGALRGAPFDSGDSNYLAGMKDPDMGFDVGIGFATRLWRGELVGNYLTDVADTHNGHEVDMSYFLPVQWGPVEFKWGAGVTWQSKKLVDYAAGVARNEVRGDRVFYAPDAAFLPHLDLSVAYPLTDNLMVIGTGGLMYLPDAYTDSSIIEDDYQLSVGLGIAYTF